jgi:hypothetical protein
VLPEGTRQRSWLRLMWKKLLVALTMEGKFAGEGLQSIDEDMTCFRQWRGNWSRGTVLARPLIPFGKLSAQNIKSYSRGILLATMMPHPLQWRVFGWILNLAPRVALPKLSTLRRSWSSDSDGNRCLVRGGVDDLPSRNRRHYSPRIHDVEATGRDLARVLRRASFGVLVSYVRVIKRPSDDIGEGKRERRGSVTHS